MKIGSFKLWRSPWVCWALFVFFAVLSFCWQIVDVHPYPNMDRDYAVGSLALGGATIVSYFFARYATKRRTRK